MNNTVRIAIATLILTGCASAPPRDTALDDARAEVDALSQQPLAQQAAADDLKNARHYLQEGDSALQQRLPMAVVDHDAYLASRSAQAGRDERQSRSVADRDEAARGLSLGGQSSLGSRSCRSL